MASWTGPTGNKQLKLQWEFYRAAQAMHSLARLTTMQGKPLTWPYLYLYPLTGPYLSTYSNLPGPNAICANSANHMSTFSTYLNLDNFSCV